MSRHLQGRALAWARRARAAEARDGWESMSHARDGARGGRDHCRAPPPRRRARGFSSSRLDRREMEKGLVLTVVTLATVAQLPDIEGVLGKIRERPHAEAAPADGPAGRAPPRLAANSPPIEVLRQRADGAELEIAGKDRANRRSLGWYHEDLLVHGRIAEWDRAADP